MNEPLSNQLQIFKSLFKGRDDVFAIRWEKPARQSGGGNKSGCMPAYFYDPYRYRIHKINGGTFQNFTDKKYLQLTDKEIAKHINGEQLIGIYPLLTDNTSWFLAADFDKEKWIDESKKIIAACNERNIPTYLERSLSGNGGPCLDFF